jgi:predicted trehalose synthase
MFNDPERSRLTMLRAWVLDNDVTEIEMKERQFWNPVPVRKIAAISERMVKMIL